MNFRVVNVALMMTMMLAMSLLASSSNVHADDGDLVWAKDMGGTSEDLGSGITRTTWYSLHTVLTD